MSAMDTFHLDAALVGDRAADAAAIPSLSKSLARLNSVFEDCGYLAGAYIYPEAVVGLLVTHVVEEYQAGRRALAGATC
ncbi:hypothetical protein ACFRJ3_34960 [Streptomyces sp. NPDC056696]|uniref:hypothetical protein n=1 Tax=unclassified Streptomyces TaxID=2593676 RepID=UPI003649A267